MAKLRGFPYMIHYRIEGQAIGIYGVRHEKQEPLEWESRL